MQLFLMLFAFSIEMEQYFDSKNNRDILSSASIEKFNFVMVTKYLKLTSGKEQECEHKGQLE